MSAPQPEPQPEPVRDAAFALRTATATDLEAIMAIERTEFPEDAWSAATMSAEIGSALGRYLVAEAAGEVLGYAGVRVAGEQADVQTIAVRADRRRAGLGRALLVELLAEASRRGAATVFLEVRADNAPAQALYARLGFVAVMTRPGYYPGGVDAIVMRKEPAR